MKPKLYNAAKAKTAKKISNASSYRYFSINASVASQYRVNLLLSRWPMFLSLALLYGGCPLVLVVDVIF
jgi:hypothetical protein